MAVVPRNSPPPRAGPGVLARMVQGLGRLGRARAPVRGQESPRYTLGAAEQPQKQGNKVQGLIILNLTHRKCQDFPSLQNPWGKKITDF